MICPRCSDAGLVQRDRDGIAIDVCESCRGVWLDRGELEKLIARATSELDSTYARRDSTPPRGNRLVRDEQQPARRRRWTDIFGDLLD